MTESLQVHGATQHKAGKMGEARQEKEGVFRAWLEHQGYRRTANCIGTEEKHWDAEGVETSLVQ